MIGSMMNVRRRSIREIEPTGKIYSALLEQKRSITTSSVEKQKNYAERKNEWPLTTKSLGLMST